VFFYVSFSYALTFFFVFFASFFFVSSFYVFAFVVVFSFSCAVFVFLCIFYDICVVLLSSSILVHSGASLAFLLFSEAYVSVCKRSSMFYHTPWVSSKFYQQVPLHVF